MGKPTVLVVEDDAAIRQGIVDALEVSEYEVISAADGETGMRAAMQGGYDLLLLDLVLPGPGGLEILAEVRTSRPTTPVIILTALGDETDRVKGLKLGADDYVVKPFSMRELTARVEAVLRRSPERPTDVGRVPIPGGEFDAGRGELRFTDGTTADLSDTEQALLRYLYANRGRAISRDEILRRVWRLDPGHIETRTIDMHVARLREKLRDDPAAPRIILTVRGKGYKFAPTRRGAKQG